LAAPPSVGSKAPDFKLLTPRGKAVQFSEVLRGGKTVLVFLRGNVGYHCPNCMRQVQDLLGHADQLKAAGARLIMVYPGPADKLAEHSDELMAGRPMPAHFDLVLDPDYKVTNLYQLRWDAANETAYPSTFIVDTQAVIKYANVSVGHGGRVSAQEVLKLLAQ
jgi:peroxiredoxin